MARPLGAAGVRGGEGILALVEAGEDPEVLVGDESPLRLVATATAGDELELKGR